jgi:hypothetical protein
MSNTGPVLKEHESDASHTTNGSRFFGMPCSPSASRGECARKL